MRPLEDEGTTGYSYQLSRDFSVADDFAVVSCYACEQLGDYERASGDPHAAVEDYATAMNWVPVLQDVFAIHPEVLDNNAALAYLALGDTRTATTLEGKALAADPADPVFLMSAGFIADRAGHVAQAARYDRAALDSDPGAFPAANDLGVELVREGQAAAAGTVLAQAAGASPGSRLSARRRRDNRPRRLPGGRAGPRGPRDRRALAYRAPAAHPGNS